MARENTVFLYGKVKKVKVRVSGDEYVSGKIVLDTVRRTYSTSDRVLRGAQRFDVPCVYSRNVNVIKNGIAPLNEGDMVIVRGSLITQDSVRSFVCPECGKVTKVPMAVQVYVDPSHVMKVQSGTDENGVRILSDDEAHKLLVKNYELGNLIEIFGTVCREPVVNQSGIAMPGERSDFYHDPETNTDKFQFQIASNRIRHILEDAPEKKTDYPWVKCYGEMARVAAEALHQGSTVFINGAIQTRKITLEAICEHCGAKMKKNSLATEIVPYHLEYINKCELPFEPIDTSDYDEEKDGLYVE